MTYSARQVLADCYVALRFLEEETDLQKWRVHWAGAVALTRAVGSVLHKVDARDPNVKIAADAAYARWKHGEQDRIFREFIKAERDNILKEYNFGSHPLEKVDVALVSTVRHPETGELRQIAQIIPIGDNIYRPLLDGYWEGDDARDVLEEALQWWTRQLDAIDAVVGSRPQPPKTSLTGV
jgi:hypothetical protein